MSKGLRIACWALLINLCSYAVPVGLAWDWLYKEQASLIASGDPMAFSHDTPPILALLVSAVVWTVILGVVNLLVALVWVGMRWHRSRARHMATDRME